MLSFIVPAHDEEALLPETLRALRASAETLNTPYEIVLVDDSSTDGTAEIGRALADRLVSVKLRQIAGTRNAGAKAARGDVLVFVDADTLVPPKTLRYMRRALGRGAVGGGAWAEADPRTPAWGRFAYRLVSLAYCGLGGNAAGCFLYARRADFDAVGGFDERLFASEEVHLSAALRKRGPFMVVRPPVVTSGRKMRLLSPRRILAQVRTNARLGEAVWGRREAMDLWYGEGLRERGGSGP
jgi:glycosyltransferase involved in cell wall biosynthesis